jgi:hypothetical protein
MDKLITAVIVALLAAGCAGGPSVSSLREGARSATFVQYGKEPLSYSFGVIDTSSFWATYGSGVAAQTGGGALWYGLESSGQADVAKRAPTAAEAMRWLYNKHPMVDQATGAVMPRLAAAWGVSYEAAKLRVFDKSTPLEDKEGNFIAFRPITDLVVVFSVNNLTLTERFTMGNALMAGVTFGTSTKNVTAQVDARMSVYKRDAAKGTHQRVWQGACGVGTHSMEIDYPFPEVIRSQEKAKTLWDAAVPKTVESCSKYLVAVSG